ncbi:MAG: M15 family metallopeptidase [Actinomycetota bacterium]
MIKRSTFAGISLCVLVSAGPLAPAGGRQTSAPPVSSAQARAVFDAEVTKIPKDIAKRMRGVSWHEGCTVPMKRLRLVRLNYWGFDREVHDGKLVVNKRHAHNMVEVFGKLFKKRFPIRRMKLVDTYGADDNRSMNHNNTSAFNCRNVAGTNDWSEHAYGRAIDINPVQNPYVRSDGSASPEKGARYVDRSQDARGMIHDGGGVVRAFSKAGWGWGGYFSSAQDYQHFSATGH